jgi:hypothetical protein
MKGGSETTKEVEKRINPVIKEAKGKESPLAFLLFILCSFVLFYSSPFPSSPSTTHREIQIPFKK